MKSANGQASTEEKMRQFLISRGWKQDESAKGPWQWTLKKWPSAHHTLSHAYDIERGKSR